MARHSQNPHPIRQNQFPNSTRIAHLPNFSLQQYLHEKATEPTGSQHRETEPMGCRLLMDELSDDAAGEEDLGERVDVDYAWGLGRVGCDEGCGFGHGGRGRGV
jgi:hypothetical protein